MTKNRIFCSHCLRVTGRWHSLLGRLNVCSPPPVPWDLKAIRAMHEASSRLIEAAGAYRDEQTEINWQVMRNAVDHHRGAVVAVKGGGRRG